MLRDAITMLIDCGEGTQHQVLRAGIPLTLDDMLITHRHADHTLGLLGLVNTMGQDGRVAPLRHWGPPGTVRLAREVTTLLDEPLPFPVVARELLPDEVVNIAGFTVTPFAVRHRGPSFGYAFGTDDTTRTARRRERRHASVRRDNRGGARRRVTRARIHLLR